MTAPGPRREHLADCPADSGWDHVDCDCGGLSRQRVTAVRAVIGAEWTRRLPVMEGMWWTQVRGEFAATVAESGLALVRPPKETTELDEGARMVRLIVEGWAA